MEPTLGSQLLFPYPPEVNCAGNYVIGTEQIEMFPPPTEVNGVLTKQRT